MPDEINIEDIIEQAKEECYSVGEFDEEQIDFFAEEVVRFYKLAQE